MKANSTACWRAHSKAARVAAANQVDVSLRFSPVDAGAGGDRLQFRRDIPKRLSAALVRSEVEQAGGLPVDGRDPALRIQADHPGADP